MQRHGVKIPFIRKVRDVHEDPERVGIDSDSGVDLSRVGPDDVIIHGKSITLRIPKPEILSTRIDNQKTRVFSRQTGILVPVDPNLETEVRREAENQLREAALRDGILAAAGQNARATLTTLLQGFGFETITVEMR